MSFANLSPADRMKASGMIGLLFVLIFFIAHTVIGSVAAKKAGPAISDAAVGTASATAPPAPGQASAPAAPGDAFPTAKLGTFKSTASATEIAIKDPFVPIRDPQAKSGRPFGTQHPPATSTLPPIANWDTHRPVGGLQPDEHSLGWDQGPKSAGLTIAPVPGGSGSMPAAPQLVIPVEPEIRLVGIVHGDPSVATLQVAGHTVIGRQGEEIAKGFFLGAVTPDGVSIRHGSQTIGLRVGDVVNEGKK